MSDLVHTTSDVLLFAALVVLLVLLALAVAGLIRAIAHVALGNQVFVSTFKGSDERRGEITILFTRRLVDIESRWIELAQEIRKLRDGFGRSSTEAATAAPVSVGEGASNWASPGADTPISSGRAIAEDLAQRPQARFVDVAAGRRTTGDELLKGVLVLAGENDALSDVDLGMVAIAGVSFSPQDVIALFRRLPGAFARRRLHGTITKACDHYLLSATFEERSRGGGDRLRYRASHLARVREEDWLRAIDETAFAIAKKRLARLRGDGAEAGPHGQAEANGRTFREAPTEADSRNKTSAPIRFGLPTAVSAWARRTETDDAYVVEAHVRATSTSETLARAEVEAESWDACQAFLEAYAAQLRHYVSGAASDRDEACAHYEKALAEQPGYTRAAYNYATLLYNRYVPNSNRDAIKHFAAATGSRDPRVRALASAGLAMAYCQAIQRFGGTDDNLTEKAIRAGQEALFLDPKLEEARFAVAWTYQVQEAWDRALEEYASVVDLPTNNPPGNRIKSFALNNSGFIWLTPLKGRRGASAKAETKFWSALTYYPNKIAYANLAEVARRAGRHDDALLLFDEALRLDGEYVNAWNERACLEIEIAARRDRHQKRSGARQLDSAAHHHARAVELAGDPAYAEMLRDGYKSALQRFGRQLETNPKR